MEQPIITDSRARKLTEEYGDKVAKQWSHTAAKALWVGIIAGLGMGVFIGSILGYCLAKM